MTIRTIVCDFGNVVAFFDHRLTSHRLASHSGMQVDAIHAYLFGGPLEDEYESGRLASADFLKQVRQTCKLTCSDEVLALAWADIFHPNEAVCGLLPHLKDRYHLLLGSNTNELHSRYFRQQFAKVLCHFEALVLSHEIRIRKPAAGFFAHCQRLTGSSAEECLFIDDVLANVQGARACGWHGIVYTGAPELVRQLSALGVEGLE